MLTVSFLPRFLRKLILFTKSLDFQVLLIIILFQQPYGGAAGLCTGRIRPLRLAVAPVGPLSRARLHTADNVNMKQYTASVRMFACMVVDMYMGASQNV